MLFSCLNINLHGKTLPNLSRNMRFPTMWNAQPVKTQISMRIRTVGSEPLLEYSMTVKLLIEHNLKFLSL